MQSRWWRKALPAKTFKTAATNICRTSGAPKSSGGGAPSTTLQTSSWPSCGVQRLLERPPRPARATLVSLNFAGAVAGQLTAFSIQVGQSLNRGEWGSAMVDSAGRTSWSPRLTILSRRVHRPDRDVEAAARPIGSGRKIYPQVRNGVFEVDLLSSALSRPRSPRADPADQADAGAGPGFFLLIPNGAFYNETGGAWVFVVAPGGGEAVKRQVRLGRRNADFIEVLEGLEPGERVITSPYTGFADKDRLDLET